MNYIRATVAAAIQQWKQITIGGGNLTGPLVYMSMIVVFTWIAMQKGDPAILTYLFVGLPLMAIWSGAVGGVGYNLTNELSNQTLQFVYASPTPLIVVSFGKALTQIVWRLPMGVISMGIVFLMTRTAPQVADIGLLLISLLFVFAGMVITSLFFSPLLVLVGGRSGFFNAINPFGLIVCGFLFPVDRLPPALEVVARCIPTSWAMENVWLSIQGTGSWQSVAGNWGMCVLTSVFLSCITYLMFKMMERRIRITGTRDLY